jgi:hypothetical protein
MTNADPACIRVKEQSQRIELSRSARVQKAALDTLRAKADEPVEMTPKDRLRRQHKRERAEMRKMAHTVKLGTVVCKYGRFNLPGVGYDGSGIDSRRTVMAIGKGVVALDCGTNDLSWWREDARKMWVQGASHGSKQFSWKGIGVHKVVIASESTRDADRNEAMRKDGIKLLDIAGDFGDKNLFIRTYVLSFQHTHTYITSNPPYT